ncbi:MAG: long-chain-fatty-acid--CoA ligase [Acidimicrobiia bacterium]|nr:long-chain-fatty-acid--CoA ligase [Acidimicrobiia bacterium]
MSSIAEITRHWAEETPDKLALVFEERSWTYAELDAASSRVGRALVDAGVRPGDRVAFLDKNVPEYFLLLLGGAKVGAVGVAVNWRLAPPEMEYILGNAEAKVLVIGEDFLGHLAKMSVPELAKVVVIGDAASSGHEMFAGWAGRFPATDPGYVGKPDETCYQLYTSGTTGLPKGVELTNDNFFSMLPVATSAWQFDQDSVSLVCMPLFHIAGSGWGLVALYTGGTDILQREVDPQEILRAIAEYRITNTLFVPAVLQFLLMTPGVDDIDYSSLRSIQYGASPISEDVLVRSMKTFGTDLVQVYGLTETTGAVTLLPAADHDPGGARAGLLRSCGKPWEGCELRIVDTATFEDVPEGEVGEIWARGRQIMKGYWRNPEATAQAKPADGWFRTGDAGYMRDGYVYIHDRVKDMVISGGENIYPAEIENVLMKHAEVADAAVIGVPSDRWGETVKAIVVRATGSEATEAALIAYCRENLAAYKCPTSVDWVEALPRNPSGKILKTELREPFWRGHERRVS